MRWSVVFFLSLSVSVVAQQAAPSSQQAAAGQQKGPVPQHQANFEAERGQANTLFTTGKLVDALPLYEDLSKQDPTVGIFAERYGAGLLAKADTTADPKTKAELTNAGLAQIQRARALGDDSPYVEAILNAASKTPRAAAADAPLGMLPLTAGYTHQELEKAKPFLQQGEQAFSQGNFADAAALDVKATKADPQSYRAALNAGDAYFRGGDLKDANVWFAKAVAIDPDRETAYRYWGDSLFSSGDKMGAKAKIIDAVIAEPFTGTTWSKLEQWARVTGTPFVIIRVKRPEFTAPDGKLKVDPALEKETGDGHSAWLVYEQVRVAHGARSAGQLSMTGTAGANGAFTPNGYVHTLDEEMAALNAMLADVRKKIVAGTVTNAKLEPGIKDMLKLESMGFLEPFVMLNFHDAGLRHGYPAYRAQHRELLARYLNSVVAPGVVR